MLGLRKLRPTICILMIIGAVTAAAGLSGCSSERREPLPPEAKTPGELKPPKLPKGPLAKNVNPNAPRSIKELQGKH
jgi:hypothetical protein